MSSRRRVRQLRLRWVWITWTGLHRPTVWLCIGGRKPLAHLPAWKRRWLHLPVIRWRLMHRSVLVEGSHGLPFQESVESVERGSVARFRSRGLSTSTRPAGPTDKEKQDDR